MSEVPETVFKFTAEGVDLEFAGSEDFVERQVKRFQQFLEGAVGIDADTVATVEQEPARAQTFEQFAAERPPREGRGAIQDRILLAVYYMKAVKGKREASGEDIMFTFRTVGWERPKNLHNALGILKRKVGHLQEGSRRGLYQLSPEGETYLASRYD
jgi:hypothetical protein